MAGRYGRGPGVRPENALKRSEELENVGQKNAALQVLHDVITGKRHRATWTWSKTYEQIMFKHIDLVVEMRKRFYGKEALSQYRNLCQTVNVASLEEVIKYYLKKASDKAEEAQSKAAVSRGRAGAPQRSDAPDPSQSRAQASVPGARSASAASPTAASTIDARAQAVTIDVADLEEDASPEDLMLSYVSGDKSKVWQPLEQQRGCCCGSGALGVGGPAAAAPLEGCSPRWNQGARDEFAEHGLASRSRSSSNRSSSQ